MEIATRCMTRCDIDLTTSDTPEKWCRATAAPGARPVFVVLSQQNPKRRAPTGPQKSVLDK
jgi:hypothetical protein